MTVRSPVVIAAVAGLALWLGTSFLTGKREPWDASAYWTVAYPAALLLSAYLGHAYPERPWRWVLVLFESQFVAMCLRNGELGSLWPLGMAMFAVIALPGVLAAYVASRFKRRPDRKAP
ncbi:hypothetical protein RHDC4_00064 [Rhodocyclaceae bacterium]|nr:hypothetical protein RHDC4_00064 [Rhodocyclaceae bacterium]